MSHFSVFSLTQVVLLLVLICWTPSSTGAAFSLEEEFLQLKENYIQMKQVVTSLESTVIEQQAKVTQLEAKVEQQDSLLTSLLREKNERTAAATDSVPSYPSAVAINGLPSSCADLKMIGHIWSGFYSVMGSAKMESVYCDFTKPTGDAGFQKWIGFADVKSAPVYFDATRFLSFNEIATPIPFEATRVNEGNAMNATSGIFTAPRPGTYFFSFTGVARLRDSSDFWCSLKFKGIDNNNNNWISGASLVQEYNGPVDQSSPLTLTSIGKLEKGDQVWVEMYYNNSTGSSSSLKEDSRYLTHFTGFMLEEEIVASL